MTCWLVVVLGGARWCSMVMCWVVVVLGRARWRIMVQDSEIKRKVCFI